jgi:hypothetical protein
MQGGMRQAASCNFILVARNTSLQSEGGFITQSSLHCLGSKSADSQQHWWPLGSAKAPISTHKRNTHASAITDQQSENYSWLAIKLPTTVGERYHERTMRLHNSNRDVVTEFHMNCRSRALHIFTYCDGPMVYVGA